MSEIAGVGNCSIGGLMMLNEFLHSYFSLFVVLEFSLPVTLLCNKF